MRRLNRMTGDEQHIFTSIYEWLYALVQHTHKGCLVDQATVMDGAIRLMGMTIREKRRREWKDGIGEEASHGTDQTHDI